MGFEKNHLIQKVRCPFNTLYTSLWVSAREGVCKSLVQNFSATKYTLTGGYAPLSTFAGWVENKLIAFEVKGFDRFVVP